jgi:thiol-disulfide isomerase/thioredoxin
MQRLTTFAFSLVAVAFLGLVFSVSVKAADKVVEKPAEKAADKAATEKATAPADRVVVMYFHRTQRCPTCLRMGAYSEESVKEKFAEAIKKGEVEFHYVDFQDKKNEALAKGYKVGGPTLIVAKVKDNKVKEFKNLEDIWAKNKDQKEFFTYVQENVTAYTK